MNVDDDLVKQLAQDTLGGLDRRVQRKVLYETAERVYKLNVLSPTA